MIQKTDIILSSWSACWRYFRNSTILNKDSVWVSDNMVDTGYIDTKKEERNCEMRFSPVCILLDEKAN